MLGSKVCATNAWLIFVFLIQDLAVLMNSIDQAGLELCRDPPASASYVLMASDDF